MYTKAQTTVRAFLTAALALAMCMAPSSYVRAKPPAAPPASFLPITYHDLKSAAGLSYRIIIAPPVGPAPAAGYPVIYVMDGNAWAPIVSEIIRINTDQGVISHTEPAVVVGIGYPIEGPFDEDRRVQDLTTPLTSAVAPALVKVVGGSPGGYGDMFDFIETVVKPDIERRFSINKQRQTLVGHSLGGLFTLRTLITHPASFQRYIACSPSVWWDNELLLKDARGFAPDAATIRSARVFIGVGEIEEYVTAAHLAELHDFIRKYAIRRPSALNGMEVDKYIANRDAISPQYRMVGNALYLAEILQSKGLAVEFHAFPDEDHFSVVPSELGRAIPFALRQ
jgi:uncharacterized protein